MGRPELILDLAVVPRSLIGVFYDQPDRGASGLAFEHTRQNLDRVGLAPLRGKSGLAWLAAIQIALHILFTQC
jgi:hypothetical protein